MVRRKIKNPRQEEATTDKILHRALKSRRRLFKHDDDYDYDDDDDDDDVQGAERGKESEDEEFFDTSYVWSPEDREKVFIRKNIQTDKVLDLMANTTPTVAQQAQTPTIAQQADMHNLRTTAERKLTQRFTPSTYNQQKTKKNNSESEKRKSTKLCNQKVKKKKKIKYKLCHH